uniref:ATP synthase subunit a n=1 Tax=Haemaphysalis flava TaxID=181088 RepID=Q76LQ8_HAEFA|nr:ATP synthase F0 subunit 6 [Haemaphysalis flava]QAX90622.1 ATP synthase F0 subunit 6 [Haemaphysalis flava]QPM99854.1 ATP synthase F0 subunit 6 [Haemaphysalis flava]UXX50241.1 ATP synthase subunit 6 [Haemaphysalis flava]BAD03987.1 ATPase 6 [Haemaphysalis flava]
MMNNLFSIFDPSTSSWFSWNWCSMAIFVFMYPSLFWKSSSMFIISWKILLGKFFQEMMNNLKSFKYKNILLFTSIFIIILFSNLFGLLPYVFTASSHLIFTMYLAFPIWLSMIIFSLLNKFNKFMSHLVPIGSPIFLSAFMVLIETVSNLIRPITLSVRLMANMISGHLLIHLLSSLSLISHFMMFFSLPVMILLMILETAVAIIQSFVFITLISLYINEV